jgi:hypothetical protein
MTFRWNFDRNNDRKLFRLSKKLLVDILISHRNRNVDLFRQKML